MTEAQSIQLNEVLETAAHPLLESTEAKLPATNEQLEIFKFLMCQPQEHLIINASAGSSKTTTLVEAVNRLVYSGIPPRDILAVAFNKSIAEALAAKMPQGTNSKTINAIGHGALRQYFPTVQIDNRKVNEIFRELIPEFFELAPAERRALKRVLELTKMNGVWPSPEDWDAGCDWLGLKGKEAPRYPQLSKKNVNPESAENFIKTMFETHSELFELKHFSSLVSNALTIDIIVSFTQGRINFIDQIYLPATCASISLPAFKQVFVDEAQDLSRIEQALLEQLVSIVPKGRLCAVGDKAQAIYAFKGADPEAFERLANRWKATKLGLSISFRCPLAVIKEAQKYDDRIQHWEQSGQGEVKHLEEGHWGWGDIKPRSAMLCRTNAPLVKAAIQCIKRNISVEFLGRDLANQLQDFAQLHGKKLKSFSGLWAQLKITREEADKRSTFEADKVEDFTDCLKALQEFYGLEKLDELEPCIKKFFDQEGNLKLATIHKSKGLEFPHVYLLRPDLCPSPRALERDDPDELQQEDNMMYVAITRAQISFTYLHGD